MSYLGDFNQAVTRYLRDRYTSWDVLKVIRVWEEKYSDGYCETCYYEEMRVYVEYTTSGGLTETDYLYADMAELINELIKD